MRVPIAFVTRKDGRNLTWTAAAACADKSPPWWTERRRRLRQWPDHRRVQDVDTDNNSDIVVSVVVRTIHEMEEIFDTFNAIHENGQLRIERLDHARITVDIRRFIHGRRVPSTVFPRPSVTVHDIHGNMTVRNG